MRNLLASEVAVGVRSVCVGVNDGGQGDLTNAYIREYQRASKKAKGLMLGGLYAATGWSRVNAHRAIRHAAQRRVHAGSTPSKPRGRKYSYDALEALAEAWTLDGEPYGKYGHAYGHAEGLLESGA